MDTYGPTNSTLLVRTERAGAAAKAGHDLTIEVTQWEATVDAGRVTMTADSRSLKVLEGTGGMKKLDADDMRNIEQTIDDEVLQGGTIAFTGTIDGTGAATGELDLLGTQRPVSFTVVDGASRAVVKQTDFGIKPYSALFGTLKVADEVTVELQSR
jgi:YceI-like domain